MTPDAPRELLEKTVREVIAACGLDVVPATGEVYNPAEGAYRAPASKVVPRDSGPAYSRYSRGQRR